jgi:hypothetical protein
VVERELLAAATSAGLPELEARAAIKSGIDAGISTPRALPESNRPRPRSQTQTSSANGNGHTAAAEKIIVDWPVPLRLAESFLENEASIDGITTLIRNRDAWYRYRATHGYEIEPDEALRVRIYGFLDRTWTPSRDKDGGVKTDGLGVAILKSIPARKSTVEEIVAALPACSFQIPRRVGLTRVDPTRQDSFHSGMGS